MTILYLLYFQNCTLVSSCETQFLIVFYTLAINGEQKLKNSHESTILKKVHMTHALNFKSSKAIPWKSYSLSNHFAAFRSNMVQLWHHNTSSCDIWCYWRPIYTISVIFDWGAAFWVAWMIWFESKQWLQF